MPKLDRRITASCSNSFLCNSYWPLQETGQRPWHWLEPYPQHYTAVTMITCQVSVKPRISSITHVHCEGTLKPIKYARKERFTNTDVMIPSNQAPQWRAKHVVHRSVCNIKINMRDIQSIRVIVSRWYLQMYSVYACICTHLSIWKFGKPC